MTEKENDLQIVILKINCHLLGLLLLIGFLNSSLILFNTNTTESRIISFLFLL